MMNRFRALRASSGPNDDSTCSRPGTHPLQDIDGRKGASVLCVTSKSEKFILSCVRLCASPRIRYNREMGTLGRYSIMPFRDGGEGSGIEVMIDSDDRLDAARWALRARDHQASGAAPDAVRSCSCAGANRSSGNCAAKASAPQLASDRFSGLPLSYVLPARMTPMAVTQRSAPSTAPSINPVAKIKNLTLFLERLR